MRKRSWLVVSFVCGSAVSAFAQAPDESQPPQPPPQIQQPPPPQPNPMVMPPAAVAVNPLAHVHHGFFFRGLLGPGGFRASASIGPDSYEVSGGGGGLSLALGGSVSPSLVVYGELFGDSAQNPTFTQNGMSSSSTNASAGVAGIGPGIAYYFPSNFYIGGTLAASRISVQQNNQEVAHSDTGIGVSLHAGYEWWVSDNWGLGIALQLYGGSIPDGQANTNWKTAGAALAFSATYN